MKPAASWCLFIPEKHKAAHYHMNRTSAEMTACWRKCPVAQPAVLLKDKFIPELEFSHYLVTVTSAESQVEFHKPTQHFWSFVAKQRCCITCKHTKWLHLVWRIPSLWKQLKQLRGLNFFKVWRFMLQKAWDPKLIWEYVIYTFSSLLLLS